MRRGSDDDLEERLECLRAALQQASKAGSSVDVTKEADEALVALKEAVIEMEVIETDCFCHLTAGINNIIVILVFFRAMIFVGCQGSSHYSLCCRCRGCVVA